MIGDPPTPGSQEAHDVGCRCPVIDNHYGHGVEVDGKYRFTVNLDCPVHAADALAAT